MPSKCKASAEVLVAAAYCWVAAGFRPFTWPMRIAVLVPLLVATAWTWRGRRIPRSVAQERAAADRRCVAVWVVLIASATMWELAALLSSPRDDHPTLSSIADDVMSTHPGRAATFALWLVVGWLLFVRPEERRA